MKIQGITFTRSSSWLAWSAAILVLIFGIFVWLPHRTQVLQSQTVLQNGKKMAVKFTLRSAWGWCEPDRLSKIEVTLDGHALPINPHAYGDSLPVKKDQPPIIVEKAGFPQVIALGQPGNAVRQTSWSFLNYGLSQRQVISQQGRSESFYAPDPTQIPTLQLRVPQEVQLGNLAKGGGMKKLTN